MLLRYVLCSTIVMASSAGCGTPHVPAGKPIALAGETMGTTYSVKLSNLPPSMTREALQRAVDETLAEVNRQMSTYRDDSEISRFNAYDGADWFSVSPETARVVADAIRVSQDTGGAFDPTVGPLVDLWSFGADRQQHRVPTDAQIATIRERVGYQNVAVRDAPPALKKQTPDLRLDLSAIAKGHAVDLVAELLKNEGVEGFLVEIGGETRVGGTKADGQPWVLGIEAPVVGARSLWRKVPLVDGSLATSGDYRNFFDEAGRRYSHMIDPRTGEPTDHAIASVSVLERNCAQADALATALCVMGPEEGYAFAVEHRVAALFILRERGELVERVTPSFTMRGVTENGRPVISFLFTLTAALLALTAMMVAVLVRHRRHGRIRCDGSVEHEPDEPASCDTCGRTASCGRHDPVQSHITYGN